MGITGTGVRLAARFLGFPNVAVGLWVPYGTTQRLRVTMFLDIGGYVTDFNNVAPAPPGSFPWGNPVEPD